MATATNERIYKLTVDATNAINKLDQIAKSTGAVEQKMTKAGAAMSSAFSGMAIGTAFIGALKTAFSHADQIMDTADAFDASAKSILKLQDAFQTFGGKAENATGALAKVSQTANDALAGVDDARKSFTDLGISMQEIAGKGADQVFITLVNAISKIPDPMKRSATAAEMLGRGMRGIDIQGMAKSLGDTAEKAGHLDTQLRAAAAGQDFLEKSWKFAKTTLAGLVGEVALFLNLVEVKAPESVTRVIAANGQWIASNDKLKTSYATIAEAQAKYNEIAQKTGASNDLIKPLQSSLKAAADESKKWNDEIEKQVVAQIQWEQALKDSINPMNEIDRNLARLDAAMAAGRLTQDQYADGFFKITEAADKLGTSAKENLDPMNVALGQTLASGVGQLVDSFDRAGQSFGEFAANFLKDIAKMIAKMYILKAIGSTSWGKSLGVGQADGGVWDKGVQKFANGGIVTRTTPFGMAGGRMGIMGEAGPEAIVPLKRTGAGQLGVQASPVNVVINNNAPVEVSQSASTGADGQTTLNILIEKRVKDLLASGGLDKSMRGAYGLTRSPA